MRAILITLVVFFLFFSPVAASDGLDAIPTWEQFLKYLCNPSGISAGTGVLLSYVAGSVAAYEALSKRNKRLIFFGASIAIPLLAAFFGALTAGWAWSWEGLFWPALAAGAVAGATGTLMHLKDLK